MLSQFVFILKIRIKNIRKTSLSGKLPKKSAKHDGWENCPKTANSGNRIFLDLPRSSSIFPRSSSIFSSIFLDLLRSSSIFLDLPRSSSISSIFLDLPRSSSIFLDLPRSSSIFLDLLRHSSIFLGLEIRTANPLSMAAASAKCISASAKCMSSRHLTRDNQQT